MTVSSQEDNDLPAESDLRARLIALMGGRAAEELLFHEVTGGAANDFDQANRLFGFINLAEGGGKSPLCSGQKVDIIEDYGFTHASPFRDWTRSLVSNAAAEYMRDILGISLPRDPGTPLARPLFATGHQPTDS